MYNTRDEMWRDRKRSDSRRQRAVIRSYHRVL